MTNEQIDEFLMHYTFVIFNADDGGNHERRANLAAKKYNIDVDKLLCDSTRKSKYYVRNNDYEHQLYQTILERFHRGEKFTVTYGRGNICISMAHHLHCMFGFMVYYAKLHHKENKIININSLLDFSQPKSLYKFTINS